MKDISQAPIGVFDSGVGGLTVAREIMRNLPNEKIVYFGDTARVPYGSKSKETVLRYSRQIVRFLRTQEVKAIVIACNTASAMALEEMRHEIDIPIIGVVRPGVKAAVETTNNKRIGVIGTSATVGTHIYRELIQTSDPTIEVFEKSCPLLCPLVEEGWLKDPVTDEVLRRYLSELLEKGIDSLIMGCTHYPLLRSAMKRIVGDSVNLVNPAYETALRLKEVLEEQGIACRGHEEEEFPYRFFVSDMAERFTQFASTILPFDVRTTQKVNIEEY